MGCHILLVVLFLSVALVNYISWKPVVTLAQFVYQPPFLLIKKKNNKSYVVAVLLTRLFYVEGTCIVMNWSLPQTTRHHHFN